jgi:hypothetical protein
MFTGFDFFLYYTRFLYLKTSPKNLPAMKLLFATEVTEDTEIF